MVRKYSTAAGVSYKYKMRLRTDAVFIDPLPPVGAYDFGPPPAGMDKKHYNRHMPENRRFPPCTRSILMPNVEVRLRGAGSGGQGAGSGVRGARAAASG